MVEQKEGSLLGLTWLCVTAKGAKNYLFVSYIRRSISGSLLCAAESNSNNKWEYENVERGNAMDMPSQLELCGYIFSVILVIMVIFFSAA